MNMETIPSNQITPTAHLIHELRTKVFPSTRPTTASESNISEWRWTDNRGELRVQIFGPDVPPFLHNRDQLIITGSMLHQPIMESPFTSWNIAQVNEVVDQVAKHYSKESEA